MQKSLLSIINQWMSNSNARRNSWNRRGAIWKSAKQMIRIVCGSIISAGRGATDTPRRGNPRRDTNFKELSLVDGNSPADCGNDDKNITHPLYLCLLL